jgi:hypothetical protein
MSPIYIAGPDGKSIAFASDAEADAYRRAQREAEPPLLKCLRKHRSEVFRLHERAEDALRQRRGKGRGAAPAELESRLRDLSHAIAEDVRAAEREAKP